MVLGSRYAMTGMHTATRDRSPRNSTAEPYQKGHDANTPDVKYYERADLIGQVFTSNNKIKLWDFIIKTCFRKTEKKRSMNR